MRDPEGVLSFDGDFAVRRLAAPLPDNHFLCSVAANGLVTSGRLLEFDIADIRTLVSPRLPFVHYPTEWCDSQFYDAAELTLDIAAEATASGYELKDASAWNVLFRGAKPIFCDHLSFRPIESRLWWAAGQFARHFVVPLWMSRSRGLPASVTFQSWRDGIPSDVARRILGPRRFLNRCWPLIADGKPAGAETAEQPVIDAQAHRFRERLYASLRWMLDGVKPGPVRAASRWASYVQIRPQYPGDSLALKSSTVARWLDRLRPARVLDLGCNTGEYSKLALEAGASVVAIDSDHDCIEQLYRRNRGAHNLVAVVATLDDLSGGRGWGGCEFPGLSARLDGRFDLAMALAVIHHLTIAASIPARSVAALAKSWVNRWLVLEVPHSDDPQVQLLCKQHQRSPQEFEMEVIREAFISEGWRVEEQVDLAPAVRTLILLERG